MRFVLYALIAIFIALASIGFSVYSYLKPEEGPLVIPSPSSTRMTESGEVIGYLGKNDVHVWRGIPYAKPPIGELRWRAPRPAERWRSRYEALRPGSACTQMPLISSDEGLRGAEDCLYLNIWAPRYVAELVPVGDRRVPVMFWIHGGGNSIEDGSTALWDGSLMAIEHNVVVVTINYRLGPLGWFTHPALREADGSAEDNSGNYGSLDIIRALIWVQSNISAFGGNPGNVTIYGESAGGFDVLTMLVSPLAKGLFHRAISQSGYFHITPVYQGENYTDDDEKGVPKSSKEVMNLLLIAQGKAPDRDSAKRQQEAMTADEISTYLRGISTEQLFAAYRGGFAGMIGNPDVFGDGHVLPKNMTPEEIFSDASNYNAVPTILGTNRDEVKLMLAFSSEHVARTLGIPTGFKNRQLFERDSRYGSESWKASAVDDLATLMRQAQGESVYAYRFDADDWRDYGFIDLKVLLGAAHGTEIPFVFGSFVNPTRVLFPDSTIDALELLSISMMSYWAEFAYNGAPGSGRDGAEIMWTPWQNEGDATPRVILLDTELDEGIRMSSLRVSRAGILKRFLADASFKSLQERCRGYRNLFWMSFDEAEYRSLGGGKCPERTERFR